MAAISGAGSEGVEWANDVSKGEMEDDVEIRKIPASPSCRKRWCGKVYRPRWKGDVCRENCTSMGI